MYLVDIIIFVWIYFVCFWNQIFSYVCLKTQVYMSCFWNDQLIGQLHVSYWPGLSRSVVHAGECCKGRMSVVVMASCSTLVTILVAQHMFVHSNWLWNHMDMQCIKHTIVINFKNQILLSVEHTMPVKKVMRLIFPMPNGNTVLWPVCLCLAKQLISIER